MLRMFNEADDFSINVQVGPKKSITANCKTSPVDIAKMDPGSVAVAGKHCNSGLNEFYVDANDVFNLARLNETSVINAINSIISANESHGIDIDNLTMVISEETLPYVDKLERRGINCMRFVNEADDFSVDVQVGPNDEIRVSEDPQTANPVDAVKRNYDSVVVAKSGDNFFTDVEDVQKCAELNCESVIDTINNIIDVNESSGVTSDNLIVVVNEYTTPVIENNLINSGIVIYESAATKTRKRIRKSAVKLINDILTGEGMTTIRASKGFYNPIKSRKFNRGKSNQLNIRLIFNNGIGSDMSRSVSIIKKNQAKIIKSLNDISSDFKFSNLHFDKGIVNTMDVVIDCESTYDKDKNKK